MKRNQCEVRMRILLAARRLFAQRGFEGTTVRQICKEAKSNLALVSYHFGGKESVFFALFDEFFPMDGLSSEGIPEDPVEGIRAIMNKIIWFKAENQEMFSIIQREILTKSPRQEQISKYIYPVYFKLKDLLENGQRQKLFYFTSVDNIMRLIIAINSFPLNVAFIKPLMTEKPHEIKTICEDTLKFMLDGLGYKLDKEEKTVQ